MNQLPSDSDERVAIKNQLMQYDPLIKQMLRRAAEAELTLDLGGVDESWTIVMTFLGVTTHYKIAEDGCITVRLEGLLEEARAFEQAAVLHEVDLFTEW